MDTRIRESTPRKRGRGRPRLAAGEETVQAVVCLPASRMAELDQVAEQLGRSRSDCLREALAWWLEADDE